MPQSDSETLTVLLRRSDFYSTHLADSNVVGDRPSALNSRPFIHVQLYESLKEAVWLSAASTPRPSPETGASCLAARARGELNTMPAAEPDAGDTRPLPAGTVFRQ